MEIPGKVLSRVFGKLCLILVATVGCCSIASGQTMPLGCIRKPSDYVQAFKKCRPIQCISPSLYGVIASRNNPRFVYPPTFKWAWVSGYENLLQYSAWQAQACNQGEVTHNILLYVGFAEKDIIKEAPYTLSVMDLSHEPTLFVPTWQAWFQAFQATFDLRIPLSTQQALTLGLGNQPDPEQTSVPVDPTQTFADITGCPLSAAAACDDQPLDQCTRPGYADAAGALMPSSPIVNKFGSTVACVSAFKKYLNGRPANVAETRAMLRYCEDVNPCNSGRGLGFNPAWMAGGEVLTHFTGREFVLLNRSLKSLGATGVSLTPIP